MIDWEIDLHILNMIIYNLCIDYDQQVYIYISKQIELHATHQVLDYSKGTSQKYNFSREMEDPYLKDMLILLMQDLLQIQNLLPYITSSLIDYIEKQEAKYDEKVNYKNKIQGNDLRYM